MSVYCTRSPVPAYLVPYGTGTRGTRYTVLVPVPAPVPVLHLYRTVVVLVCGVEL